MTIPKRLKIGGHIVKILVNEKLENMVGEFSSRTNTIKISSDLPQSQKELTLIHELFHAVNTDMDNTTDGHRLLNSLAEQLYQVLKDNHLLK